MFVAGKISDNIGAFIQGTYDNYANQDPNGHFAGQFAADNMDFRYADRLIGHGQDLIIGVSFNNAPSVSDPWNTAAAWMQYVPVPSPPAYQFVDGTAPYPGYGADANVAGITLYAFWNQTVSHEWQASNIMVGTSGMIAHVYDPGSDYSSPANLGRYRNNGFDAQYQYLLDPHTVTAQLAFMHQLQEYSANAVAGGSPYYLANGVTPVAAPNGSDITNILRGKISYIYRAGYGGSVSFFNETGSSNTLNQSAGYDTNGQITANDPFNTGISSTPVNGSLSGNPGIRGLTYEVFCMPIQNLRLGLQYTAYSRYNGAADDYDGFGRSASDNNTLFAYAWVAY